ncbi:UDP-2,3-diacylglucosamine diphosphatase [Methylophaga sulfidovorans]|uniref:UDP-2,3-diacylglucosamine hydrolase n=1 Tax=Methylophaga sulfidovorans TaxID=45496 RepID=A0A1I3YKX7_9GAMM|nr:UDP-2,3-diacylglucosamine diphosphatase [Methylophaga sulfidovorans]SFK32482.1 UDP-2,3-diacylglucosamine hydrolase [Methylophaga sulfidovorans]
MTKLFISDLHLNPARPELTALACQFLRQQVDAVSEIYILGDIFNTWLGDDLVPDEFTDFIDTLRSLTQAGINLYLMVGNRDFMLGKAFADSVNATLIQDGYLLELAGKPALLLHGDSLCIDDVGYQRYRKVVNNRLLQWCFLKLPARFRQKISDKIKQQSQQKKQYKSSQIMDVNQAEVEKVMFENNVKLLIHGHTHRPAIHQVTLNNSDAYRIVLGDWEDKVSYLLVDDQQLTLHDHRLDNQQQSLRSF